MRAEIRWLLHFPLLSLIACGDPDEPSVPKALLIEAERTAVSTAPTPKQALPYEEALVFHSYAVKEVVHGELTASQIQVGHWAVVNGQAQPVDSDVGETTELEILPIARVDGAESIFARNDLTDYEAPQFIEVPPDNQPVATGFREEFGGPFSKQMELYWGLRHQLRLVAIGNSRTACGVLTGRFFPDVSGATPVSLNFSPAGSNMELQSLLVQEYVLPLPKLEWVVWGVCPRFFNEHRRDNDRIDQFTESHGYRYDQEHADELWPIPENTPLQTVAQVNDWGPPDTDVWGATPREDGHSPSLPNDAARKKFLDQFDIVRFDWDATQWDLFVDRLKDLHERNIRVLVFTPPTHPLARDGRASDPDSTGREHEAMVIDRLEALDSQFSNMWFEDIHRAGHHEFTNDDFSDAGHLDQSGADRLTARLARRVHHLDAAGS